VKKFSRLFTIATAAALSLVSVAAFAGCETNNPEVTITYEFNGTKYEVEYQLSRKGAPQTVRHFIELADAGYYNDTVIHDYVSDGTFLYGGGYTWNENATEIEDKLVEKDYWTELKKYEEENNYSFTQSVTTTDGEKLYTLYGEFSENGCEGNSKTYKHSYSLYPGALVMYYTAKGSDTTRVSVTRSDSGETQSGNYYKYNCATSLFYTWTGTGSRTDLDDEYSVFGCAKDYSQLETLLDAIKTYESDNFSGDEESFTEMVSIKNVNQYDPIETVKNSKIDAEYNVPTVPIYIRTVKVTKY